MPDELATQTEEKSGDRRSGPIPRWLWLTILLGLYLTLRGYHSRDGDQAYRLPILLHQQSPKLYADDPFVRAFDQFNPHRGAFLVLDAASRVLGLSGALFALFALTFLATGFAVDRLARKVWPEADPSVGVLAFMLLLTAKAGNIGTNHLFEAMLLDRMQAFALGWVAIAASLESRSIARHAIAPSAIGLATWIHPSAGLQLAMSLAISWLLWGLFRRSTGATWRQAITSIGLLGMAVVPGLLINGSRPGALLEGLSPDEYWTLAVELQSPQHMLPHLWRRPQWLAWGCYFVLAALAWRKQSGGMPGDSDPSRTRVGLILGVILVGLATAWVGIEVVRDVRLTVFQPFRMATIARGLSIVFLARYVLDLWQQGEIIPRLRASAIAIGLTGDWLLVVVTGIELAWHGAALFGWLRSSQRIGWRPESQVVGLGATWFDTPNPCSSRCSKHGLSTTRGTLDTTVLALVENRGKIAELIAATLALALGVRFLIRHDTESGHIPLLITLAVVGLAAWRQWPERIIASKTLQPSAGEMVGFAAWIVPLLALGAGLIPADHPLAARPEIRALVARCRFTEVAEDDVERLAAWCREHTPEDARFVGPPGPKTFRLWSRRSLAFNRSSSPYHAEGLADWFDRFRDHVRYSGSSAAFVRQYIRNRHGIESKYDTMSPADRIDLAVRQGAAYMIAAAPSANARPDAHSPLKLLHVEGKYAVYGIRADQPSDRVATSGSGRQTQR